MDYIEQKQEIISNIQAHKQKISELQQYLKGQHEEYNEMQKKIDEEKQRRKKAKSAKSKFSSFENAINRPPFFSAAHQQQVFHEQSFIDNGVTALTATQKEELIMPSRNKNPASITYKIDHPINKLYSDFPTLTANQMSEKEITRLNKWQQIVENRTQMQIEEQHKTLIGSLKKQQLEQRDVKVFSLANTNLRMFEGKPSLISENPLTPRRLEKLITLPRLYEKKVWVPNNNYY